MLNIPFALIDYKINDIFLLLKDLAVNRRASQKENLIIRNIQNRFPNKKIELLPSARLGFYLTLKKYFKKGDEIIFSSMSFPLYIKIAKQLDLKVRLVDVNQKDMNINEKEIERKIKKNTKGIVITHLFGYPCNLAKITKITKKYNLKLIEDCAQSFGTYYKKKHTGNFGNVGIFSTSLVKIPTTLGGGILVTEDENLIKLVQLFKKKIPFSIVIYLKYFLKNFISLLNSKPLLYTLFSSKIFSLLNRFNPRLYRKIIYSGMGLNNKFNPLERINLGKYQLTFGQKQFVNHISMKNKCKKNSLYIINKLKNYKNISFLKYDNKVNWNYQYLIIKVENGLENFSKKMFNNNIHSMEENVWDCLDYNYKIENHNDNFKNTKLNSSKLIRIQNSPSLKKKDLDLIIKAIKNSSKNKIK